MSPAVNCWATVERPSGTNNRRLRPSPNQQSTINNQPSPASRRAFTLIEMLIVVTIMMILVSAAAMSLRPDNDSRRIREAARAVNLYLASARNRAMETGRPCGVILRRFNETTSVMTMDQCEVPPPYCGDTETATATVRVGDGLPIGQYIDPDTGKPGPVYYNEYEADPGTIDFVLGLVHVGDQIQFNQQGPRYTVVGPSADSGKPGQAINNVPLKLDADLPTGQLVPWNNTYSAPMAYRITRAPSKGAAQPLQLPAATIVDLTASGTDAGQTAPFSRGLSDIIILFSPDGSVQCVYTSAMPYPVVSPIFLLIGKQERMGTTFTKPLTPPAAKTDTELTNCEDLNNLWVVINPQTGLITSDVVAESSKDALNAYNLKVGTEAEKVQAAADAALHASRLLAREGQGMGGK